MSIDQDQIYILANEYGFGGSLDDTAILRYENWFDTTPEVQMVNPSHWTGIAVEDGVIYLLNDRTNTIHIFNSWGEDFNLFAV